MSTYRIVRYFRHAPKLNRMIVREGLTREEAQMHCNHSDRRA
jgi:hypothetical protein